MTRKKSELSPKTCRIPTQWKPSGLSDFWRRGPGPSLAAPLLSVTLEIQRDTQTEKKGGEERGGKRSSFSHFITDQGTPATEADPSRVGRRRMEDATR